MKKAVFLFGFVLGICASARAQLDFECYGGFLTGADCQICTGQTSARLFSGLIIRQGSGVLKLVDCPYYVRRQGNNLIFTELIPNAESITVNLLSTGFSTMAGFMDSTACMCARQDSSWIGGGGSGDPSITNEGVLGVDAAGANTSKITSNTSGATGVTISGSTTVIVTETPASNGGTILLQADTSVLATVNDVNAVNCRWCSVKHAMPFYSNNPQTAFEALRTYWASRMGEIVVDTTVLLTANTTVAASVRFVGGGNINVDAGHTVTFQNAVHAEPKHFVFTGAGDYDLNAKSVAVIYPYWFGALGNNSADDYDETQKAIDCAIRNEIGTVRFLSGYHLVSKGLLVRNGSNTVTLTIEGNANYDADVGTNIVCTDSTNFAIAIQGARSCVVKNMYLRGKGSSYNPTIAQIITNTKAQWRAQYGRDDRYSPFSGIVIDPFKTTAPTGGGYPGFSAQYSNSHALSSQVTIEGVVFRYFPVGLMISPSGQNGNAAEITVRGCTIDRCEYGIATANTQSRDVNVVNTNIGSVAACLDGVTFGGQESPMPTVIGGQLSVCKDILRYTAGRGDGKIIGTYSESVYRIGKWVGNNGATLNLNNCEIKFATSTETGLPDAASVLDATGCKVIVEGGSLQYSTQRPVELNAQSVHLTGVYLNRPVLNNPGGNSLDSRVIYDGCQIDGYGSQFFQSPVELQLNGLDFQRIYRPFQVPGNTLSYYELGTSSRNVAVFKNDNDAEDHTAQMEGSVTVTVDTTARTATFTASNPGRYRVGDILFAYNNTSTSTPNGASKACSFGIVSSIVSTTVTCSNIPSGIASGSFGIYLWKEVVFIGTFIANITSGSNKCVITSKNTHGLGLSSLWTVGTRVYSKTNQAYNSGLYTGLYVASVTADTLFLSGNVGSTVSGLEIFNADYRGIYYSEDNTYQTGSSTFRTVGYQTGDEIVFASHAYRARATVTAGGFTPSVKFLYKKLTGLAAAKPTPTADDAGLTYFSTDTDALEVWDGTAWNAQDASAVNEAWTIDGDDADTELITTQTVKFTGASGITTDWNPATDVFTITGSGGTVTGSATANQVTYWTGTSSIGGDAGWTFDATANAQTIDGLVTANNQNANKAIFGAAVSGSPQYPGIWLTNASPSFSNYAFLADIGATANLFNAPTGGSVQFRINNGEIARVTATGVGIGATPVNKLDVEGAAVIGATYSGTNTASTNGLLVEGNVGIGNTSAARKLHVTGEMRVTDLTTDSPTRLVGADADGDFNEVTAAGGLSISGTTITMPSGTTDQTLRHNGTNWIASSEIINDDAAVGIGGNPVSGFELYVNGAQRNDGAVVSRATGSNFTASLATPHLRLWNTTATTGDTWYLGSEDDGDFSITSSNLGAIQFLVENTTGDVGIGNTAPTQKLHVTGSARVTGAFYDSNNDPGTGGQVLSSTVTGTDWIAASGGGTLTAANNGLYVSGTTVRMGTNPLIEATLIDQNANDMRFYDGKWSFTDQSASWTPTQGMGIEGAEASPTTNTSPTKDGIIEFRTSNAGSAQPNSLVFGGYATDADGIWMQARSHANPSVEYPLSAQPRGGQFSVGRLTGLDAQVTLTAIGLSGSTVSGSVLHWESSEGNLKAAATFGVGTDVADGEIGYFDAADIVRVTNRNTTTGTSSFRIAVGGETSDRVTVVAATVTPNARMGIGTTAPNSTLHSAGSFASACVTFTGALTLDERDDWRAYTGTTNVTVTLPAASTCNGREYTIHHRGTGGTLTLSIAINKGNGLTFNTLTAGQFAFIKSDGTVWNGIKLASL